MTHPDLGPAFAAIDAYVAERIYADGSPGVALALTDRERTLRVATYGSAEVAAGVPVAPETLFQIGSIGKSLTADALLILAERGAVDLDAPVERYLPWFAVRSRFYPIRLRDLLTHTAGIISGPDGSPSGEGEVWQLRETEAAGPPGSRFHYSNVGYKALGLVVAAVAGRSYPEAIRELLLAPLGMDATAPAITNDARPRHAVGYVGLHDDRPFHPRHPLVPATWLVTDTGDGCLACPPADLAAYARYLLNRGRGPAGPLLREASFAQKVAPSARVTPGFAYGYGIALRSEEDRTVIGHGGGMVGYVASLQVDPESGFGVVVLINGPGSPGAISRHALAVLAAVAAGQEPPQPADTRPAADVALAGSYRRVEGEGPEELRVVTDPAAEHRLLLVFKDESVALEPLGGDEFVADHPALARFRLSFERDEDGRPVAVAHGGAWYARPGTVQSVPAAIPAEWDAYVGHYRSHNPWIPSFDVVRRRGRLWLVFPAAPDGFDDEQSLDPLDESGYFRAGDDPGGPERLRLDAVAAGRALRATLSGCPFWRVGLG